MKQTTTRHAATPTLCADCRAKIIGLAECTLGSPIVSLCQHQSEPDLVALVIAHTHAGVILQFDCQGPMSFEKAQQYTARICALIPEKREYRAS